MKRFVVSGTLMHWKHWRHLLARAMDKVRTEHELCHWLMV